MAPQLRERKLIQWTLAYLAGAWVLLEASGELSDMFGWPDRVQLVLFVLLLFGLFAVVVIGWFHAEKGRQKVSRLELTLLAVIAVIGLTTALAVAVPADGDAASALARRGGSDAGELTDVDTTRYAVLPFEDSAGSGSGLAADVRLHDALARWRGIQLVDLFEIRDAAATAGAGSLETDRRLAARFGAGRLVRGRLGPVGSALRLRVALHDTRSGALLSDTTLQLDAGAPPPDALFVDVAAALLFRGAGLEHPPDRHEPAVVFPARVAFLGGLDAMRDWDLERAAARFAEAGRLAPEYARAHLWRAQALHWSDQRGPDVLGPVQRAVADRGTLSRREGLLADGLLGLELGEYHAACAAYRALRELDEDDFAAWYGLGECRARDDVVVRAPSSPSGWRFRSSYHGAVEAYRRAFDLFPSTHRGFASRTLDIVRERLFTGMDKVRSGSAAPPDSGRFAAFPALRSDTLAFVPWTLEDFAAGRPETQPSTQWAAVERQRRRFRDIAARWAAAFPDSPEALEGYALALDLLGNPAALDTLQVARALARGPEDGRRLAIRAFGLTVKFAVPDDLDALRRGRALADSLLRQEELDREVQHELAAVAALAGRVFAAAALARRSATPVAFPGLELPVTVTAPAAALSVYAALGAPADSIAVYEQRVLAAVRNRLPPGEQRAARHYLLDRPATLAAMTHPLAGTRALAASTRYRLLRAQAALMEGDTTAAADILDGVLNPARPVRPADRTPDTLYPEAGLAAALGDTAVAVAMLDSTLNALQWLDPGALDDLTRAGALVPAMMLRARLAAALGDTATAARWARAVAALWADADAPLEPVVEAMRELGSRDPDPRIGLHSPPRPRRVP